LTTNQRTNNEKERKTERKEKKRKEKKRKEKKRKEKKEFCFLPDRMNRLGLFSSVFLRLFVFLLSWNGTVGALTLVRDIPLCTAVQHPNGLQTGAYSFFFFFSISSCNFRCQLVKSEESQAKFVLFLRLGVSLVQHPTLDVFYYCAHNTTNDNVYTVAKSKFLKFILEVSRRPSKRIHSVLTYLSTRLQTAMGCIRMRVR